MRLVSAALSLVLLAAPVAAQKDKSSYVDTKQRFALKLPLGWRLHPMPGDTQGMMFRRDVDGVFAIFHVSVRPQRPGESLADSLEDATRPFRAEIGFSQGQDLPTSVGLQPGMRRSLTVYASGDARTVRAVELYVLHAFGHVHTLHFESLASERSRFSRDQDRLVGSYEARAGKKLYGDLVGQWESVNGGPRLVLTEEGRFTLGPLMGTWSTDGGRLSLHLEQGSERYRYVQQGRRLTLHSSNLDEPMVYERSGSARFSSDDEKVTKAKPATRADLVGRWRVIDVAATEPLVLHLAPSGSVAFGPLSGRWQFSRGLLTITSTAGETVTYHASLYEGRLKLGGGDLDREMTLVRE